MKVTKADVENVALLSRLAISEAEMPEKINQLNDFLEYVDRLSELDTTGIHPMAHVLPINNVFREDIIRPSLDRELALANAPEQEDGYFVVPRILED